MPDSTRCLAILLLFLAPSLIGQVRKDSKSGILQGTVSLESNGALVHNASVLIIKLGRTVDTDENGFYEFASVPPGIYTVAVHMHGLADKSQRIEVIGGEKATLDFVLSLSPVREEITVTASGREESSFDSFQSVTSLESVDLVSKSQTSLGEVLDNQPGVAKRSYGPGPSRPVIRGFDGDRVLILEDGIRTGTLSSQSGDHGETIDAQTLEKLEVVKGPATLLYGSNAIGGVVNAVSGHNKILDHPHTGLRGYATGIGGSNNGHGGGSAGFEYGFGDWLIWSDGGGQRTGDMNTPLGEVENSHTRLRNGSGGAGWFGEKAYVSGNYGYEDGLYGIPLISSADGIGEVAGPVDISLRRHNARVNTGLRELGSAVEKVNFSFSLTDYQHQELEGQDIGTTFKNKQAIYQGTFEQRHTKRFSGTFGFWGMGRKYRTSGEEAISPPVDQHAIAVFGLEELDFERVRFQLGGRVEHNGYTPVGLPERSFTGFSGAAGVHVPLWKGGAFVSNFTHSYRAPALEELYNYGPHPGNLTFEIGNPNLIRELGNGLDVSLRHSNNHVRAEANFYYYAMGNFVYLAPTGNINAGLIEAKYLQANSRFTGIEAGFDVGAYKGIWLNFGFDTVNAKLTETNTPLPRIPPLRGRFGVDARFKGLSVRPEVVMASDQSKIFPTETRTAGYTVVNLNSSYTIAGQHCVQVFSLNAFNLGDRLYRNHLSFIKDFVPEIGRGIRITYTIRFF